MNSEQIIQTKLNFLSGESQNDLSAEMDAFVAKDSTLEEELYFIEKFWNSTKGSTDELPSSQLSKGAKSSYGQWCTKNGIKYYDRIIPLEWLEEKGKDMHPSLIHCPYKKVKRR